MSAPIESGGSILTAADFFGGNDPEGVEKFKTIALRALHDQKLEEELRHTKSENERLTKTNAALSQQLKDLELSLETNIDDRERVLAFKSKRIEELLIKVKEYESINASLLETIGSDPETDAGRYTKASISLLQNGQPLFHAVETCKEQDYRRQLEDKKHQCEELQQEILGNVALIEEMNRFKRQKADFTARIAELEATVERVTIERDDKVHFLERKLVFEHDRLSKEKESDIRRFQEEMAKQMRTQLDATTQRTIEENVRVQLELRYQSSQLEKMVKQMDALLEENRRISQEKTLADEMNATLSKRVKFYEHLFAKMQQKDHTRSKTEHTKEDREFCDEYRSPNRRKPPLPSLPPASNPMTRSAFSLSSPPVSPSRQTEYEDNQLTLNMSSLNFDGDQLNSATSALDSHIHRREFTRKQVQGMIAYHQGTASDSTEDTPPGLGPRIPRRKPRKVMLLKSEYSPSTFPPRGGRRIREAPLTLDTFIKDHATISPRNRKRLLNEVIKQGGQISGTQSPNLPVLPSNDDTVALWKATRPTEVRGDHEGIQTARF